MTDFSAEQLQKIRSDFPILTQKINNNPLIYFDNAATTQKPNMVIDAVSNYYKTTNASYQRSSHTLAFETAKMIDNTKKQFLEFINLNPNLYDVIFTKNTTESINLIAYGYFHKIAKTTTIEQRKQQIILVSGAEHHSNLLPWMRVCEEQGYQLAKIPLLSTGELDYMWFDSFVSQNNENIVFLAVTHASNVTGIVTNIERIKEILTANNSIFPLLIDGAQTVGHLALSLNNISPDFFACSAHKMYSPSGVGLLVIKKQYVAKIDPLLIGGGMVASVSKDTYEPFDTEQKFHAGTPNAEAIAGFSAGLNYLKDLGMETVRNHELALRDYFAERIKPFTQLQHIGDINNTNKLGIFAFSIPNWHPHDASDFFDKSGIAVRAGYHCAEPLHYSLNSSGTIRISFGLYNTTQEVDIFITFLLDISKKKF